MTGNNAILVNPNVVNDRAVAVAITTHGSDFYYAICAAMGTVTLGIIAASALKPRTDRIFFYITASVTMTATVAYFAMGSNLGWVPIDVEWLRANPRVHGRNREIFYVRYIDWLVTNTNPA
jgi:bacteriorhodopsin